MMGHHPSRYPRLELVALSAAAFLAVVDASVVSIALPEIEEELDFSTGATQWVLNAYGLALAAMLLPAGRLADLFGARRVYLGGLALFAVASLAAGLAWSPGTLLAARAAQGLGAGAFLPAALALISGYGRDVAERNRAVGIYGAAASLGFVSGIVFGGVLTELLGWRSTLLIGVPLGAGAYALAGLSVPRLTVAGTRSRLDLAGAVTGLLTVVGLNLGLFLLAVGGAGSLLGGAVLVASIGCGLAFVRAERRAVDPLIPLEIFRNRQLVAANAAILLKSVVGVSMLFTLTYYFQDVRGAGAGKTSLLFLPMTLIGISVSLVAGRLTTRVGIRRLALAGLVLLGVGLSFIARLPVEGTLVPLILATMVSEIGYMLSEIPMTIAGSSALPPARRGLAASLFNVSINLGNGLGLTVVGAIVALRAGEGADDPGRLAAALRIGVVLGIVGVALSALVVALRLREAPDAGDGLEARAEIELAGSPS